MFPYSNQKRWVNNLYSDYPNRLGNLNIKCKMRCGLEALGKNV